MADYPTRQFTDQRAWDMYQDAIEKDRRKKNIAAKIHQAYMLINPRYKGSSAAAHNQKYVKGLGTGTSSGLATRLRLMGDADKEMVAKQFTTNFQDWFRKNPNATLDEFNKWGNEQGPWYSADLRSKHANIVLQSEKEKRSIASEERQIATHQATLRSEEEKDIIEHGAYELTNKYAGRYSAQTAGEQAAILSELMREIQDKSGFPKDLQNALFLRVANSLKEAYGASGSVNKAIKDAERDQWRFNRDKQVEADRQAKYGREKEVAALDRTKGRLTARLAEKAANLWQANKDTMSREEALQTVLDESEKLYTTTTAIEARMGVRDALEKLIGKDEDVTPTSGLKITEEMYSLLADSGDPEENLINARKAFESENRRGASLNPAWYDYGVKKGYAIAADNFVRVLSMADSNRYGQLMELKQDYEKYIATVDPANQQAETVKAINDAVKKLGLPYMIIEYILFPEEYAWGKK